MHYNNEPDYTFFGTIKNREKITISIYLYQNTENHRPAAAERGLFVQLIRRGMEMDTTKKLLIYSVNKCM